MKLVWFRNRNEFNGESFVESIGSRSYIYARNRKTKNFNKIGMLIGSLMTLMNITVANFLDIVGYDRLITIVLFYYFAYLFCLGIDGDGFWEDIRELILSGSRVS